MKLKMATSQHVANFLIEDGCDDIIGLEDKDGNLIGDNRGPFMFMNDEETTAQGLEYQLRLPIGETKIKPIKSVAGLKWKDITKEDDIPKV